MASSSSSSLLSCGIKPSPFFNSSRRCHGHASRLSFNRLKLGAQRLTVSPTCYVSKAASVPPTSTPPPPWMLLPPVGERSDYYFYDITEHRIRSYEKRRDSDEAPPDAAAFVGSSHGWLATFDARSSCAFLSNPISGRHIKLPPLHGLTDPYFDSPKSFPDYDGGQKVKQKVISKFESESSPLISRVILSCSPDHGGADLCKAITAFGPGRRLAFCTPEVSTEWTPLGHDAFANYMCPSEFRPIVDFMFCSQTCNLMSITPTKFNFCFDDYPTYDLELDYENDLIYHSDMVQSSLCQWKLFEKNKKLHYNYDIPYLVGSYSICDLNCEEDDMWKAEGYDDRLFVEMLKRDCYQIPHLVWILDERKDIYTDVDGRTPPLLTVLRFVNREMGNKTVFFLVIKYDVCVSDSFVVVRDLNGAAIFVGKNHSFAYQFPDKRLKPNSIYFTPSDSNTGCEDDCGVFDYQNKTICYFEPTSSIFNPLMWFTPNF